MKKAVLLILISMPLGLLAQQGGSAEPSPEGTVPTSVTFPIERVLTPTNADLICSGFISKDLKSRSKFVSGGLESPFTTQFADGEVVFLNGKGYELGQEYEIVRELVDPNHYELFQGQWASLKAAGHAYEELGHVRIVDLRNKMTVARVTYSCNTILPGDFVIPYVAKAPVEFHSPKRFDVFMPPSGTSGRIVLAKDFDSELGDGAKVFINIGSGQGLKPGDYMRVTRTFEATRQNANDSLSFKVTAMEPTQARQPSMDGGWLDKTNGPAIHVADMPRKAVGEVVILSATNTTATGMIVFSLEPIHVGDRVEVDQQ
jgi:hypothetical protein